MNQSGTNASGFPFGLAPFYSPDRLFFLQTIPILQLRSLLRASIMPLFAHPTDGTMPETNLHLLDSDIVLPLDDESGYASGSSSEANIPQVFFTKSHLSFLNRQLQDLEPRGRLYQVMVPRA